MIRFDARFAAVAFLASLVWAGSQKPALALTPESPEVKAAIKKGLAYLEKNFANEERTGGQALAALAFVKDSKDASEAAKLPLVQAAIKKIRTSAANNQSDFYGSEQVYNLGVSVILLANLDETYRNDLQRISSMLFALQQPGGGWGYPQNPKGDNSMTQYGALGLWESYRAGVDAPLGAFEKCCNFLIRVQDPGGGFGYQANDGGSRRVAQEEIKHSLTAAAMGGLYICVDHFEFGQGTAAKPAQTAEAPTSTLIEKIKTAERIRAKRRTSAVDQAKLKAACELGDAWFDKNETMEPSGWRYYFLYAYERYKSFKEVADSNIEKEPKWYTDWAKNIIASQVANGSWANQAGNVPDTSFAVLFLLRSTKKSIQASVLGGGNLVGGKGMPKDLTNVQVKNGNFVQKPLQGPADDLLSVLNNPNDPNYQNAVQAYSEKVMETDAALISKQKTKLKQLAGGDAWELRAVAIRALGRERDLDNVPLLLFALGDADYRVAQEAHDALRFISRKFAGFGLEINSDEGSNEAARESAKKHWKAWYLSIRPDAVLED